MSIQQFLAEMKTIQRYLLEFFMKETNIEENFQNLNKIFEDLQIHNDKHKFKSVLHLLVTIANNHHRGSNFFTRIDLILKSFKNDIKKYFSNSEIFIFFKNNKRILLFFIEESVITFDEYVVKSIIRNKKFIRNQYLQYFQPEIQPFQNEKWFKEDLPNFSFKELPENFYKNRRSGENEDLICEMIRADLIDEFIPYANENFPLGNQLKFSIYETNSFLLNNQNPTLIEYAAFFGSVKIFKYLFGEGVKISPSIYLYVIHGQNNELIHIIEEDNVKQDYESYYNCLIESIKCYNNNFANYFNDKYLQSKTEHRKDPSILYLKYYNFAFLIDKSIDKFSFYNLCKYDYYIIVKNIMNDIDINQEILIFIFLYSRKNSYL